MVLISAITLVSTNLISLIGVLYLGWSVRVIIAGYFAEAYIMGIFNVLKLFFVQGEGKERQLKNLMKTKLLPNRYGAIKKFILTYAIFISINAIIFMAAGLIEISIAKTIPLIVAYTFSHGISFMLNFIVKKEYQGISLYEQFIMPFKRIAITQFPMWLMATLCVGIWILGVESNLIRTPITNFSVPIFTSMMVYKTILDLGLHIREHKNYVK